jgi:hypothetical protein
MKLTWVLIIFLALNQLDLQSSLALQHIETSYLETRKLLLTMERDSDNKALKKLFQQGDERISDLLRAIYYYSVRYQAELNSGTFCP